MNLNEQLNRMKTLMGLNEGFFDNPLKIKLEKEYEKLNKEYIELDKSLDLHSNDPVRSEEISTLMDILSRKMGEISTQLENL